MKKSMLSLALLTLFTTTFNASAVQKDITVTAEIEPHLEVTKADGSPLPTSLHMHYRPGEHKLAPITERVKIWTNSDKNLDARLADHVVLTNPDGDGHIPLTIRLGGKTLHTTNTEFLFDDLFPTKELAEGSKPLGLHIRQTTETPGLEAGHYTGMIKLLVTQGVH